MVDTSQIVKYVRTPLIGQCPDTFVCVGGDIPDVFRIVFIVQDALKMGQENSNCFTPFVNKSVQIWKTVNTFASTFFTLQLLQLFNSQRHQRESVYSVVERSGFLMIHVHRVLSYGMSKDTVGLDGDISSVKGLKLKTLKNKSNSRISLFSFKKSIFFFLPKWREKANFWFRFD